MLSKFVRSGRAVGPLMKALPAAQFGKEIRFGTDARTRMLEGCDMLADAV